VVSWSLRDSTIVCGEAFGLVVTYDVLAATSCPVGALSDVYGVFDSGKARLAPPSTSVSPSGVSATTNGDHDGCRRKQVGQQEK
jgi:hypothetical protein